MFDRRFALLALVVLGFLLGGPSCSPTPVGTNAVTVPVGSFSLSYSLASSRRIGRTIFEYTYTAQLTNNGSTLATGATATVSSGVPETVVTDPNLTFGDLTPGQTLPSLDVFVIEQDRTVPFDPADLSFQVMAGTGSGTSTPPTGLGALPGNRRAILGWDADPNPLALYHVYRSTTPANLASYQRLTPAPISQPRFTDLTVTNGVGTYFAVTTVVGSTESAFSEPVGVLAPGFQTAMLPFTGNDTRLSARLAGFKAHLADGDSVASAASGAGLRLGPNGELFLRAFADDGNAAGQVAALQAVGALDIRTGGAVVRFSLPATNLGSLIGAVAVSAVEEEPEPQTTQALSKTFPVSEGTRTIGADDLMARFDVTGKNVKIAIHDPGFRYTGDGLDQLVRPNLTGTPPAVTRRFCPTGSHNAACPFRGVDRFERLQGTHGSAVVQVVHDTAPDAELLLYAPMSPDEYLPALVDAVTQGAQIATYSMFYPAPEDDVDGSAARVVSADALAANQIMVTHAASNQGDYRTAIDTFNPDGNGYHIWNNAKYPTAKQCVVEDPTGTTPSVMASCLPMFWYSTVFESIFFSYNQWPNASVDDLDLVLYTGRSGQLSALNQLIPDPHGCGSCSVQPLGPGAAMTPPSERLYYGFQGSVAYLVVQRKASTNAASRPRFRMHVTGNLDFRDGSGGGSPPGAIPSSIVATEAASPNILAVGATRWNTDRLETYSSRGPAVDPANGALSRAKPDIAGPACTSSSPLSPEFCGTSAATPHVAAAGALLIELCGLIPCADTNGIPIVPTNAADLRRLLRDKAFDLGHVPISHGPNDPANAWGSGRVDVTPPLVFSGSDGALYRRDVTPPGDVLDGLVKLPFAGEQPAISPDGTRLAYQARVGSSFEIFVVDLYDPQAQPMQLTFGGSPRAAYHPVWSPDGQKIAYIERNRYNVGGNLALAFSLDIVNTDGSGKDHRVITFSALTGDNPGAAFPSWSPDGLTLAFTLMTPQPGSNGVRYTAYQIATVPAAAANVRPPNAAVQVLTSGIRPRFSPDGTRLTLMTLNDPNPDRLPFPLSFSLNPTVRLYDLTAGSLVTGGFPGAFPIWSPAGTRMVFTRNPTEGQTVDPGNFHLFQGWFDDSQAIPVPLVGLVDELQLTNTLTLGRIQGTSVPGQSAPTW